MDKGDSVSCFRDGAQESETSVKEVLINVAPSEAGTQQQTEFPVREVLETCPTATAEERNSSDSSAEEADGETLETGAIRKFYSDLSNAISQQLDVVSTELYQCGLIERPQLDQILAISGKRL